MALFTRFRGHVEDPTLPATTPIDSGWDVSCGDFRRVFVALPEIVGPQALLCVAGNSIVEPVLSVLRQLSVSPSYRVSEGGWGWPRPQVFHVPATQRNLAQLAEASASCAEPEFMDHLVVYEEGRNLLEWWDAPFDPMHVSAAVTEDAVERFCRTLEARATRLGV